MICLSPPESLYTYDGESILTFDAFGVPSITDHAPAELTWGDAPERRRPFGKTVAECARWLQEAYTRNNFDSSYHGLLEDWLLPNLEAADIEDDAAFDGFTLHNKEWWEHWRHNVLTVKLGQTIGLPRTELRSGTQTDLPGWLQSSVPRLYANSGKWTVASFLEQLFPFQLVSGGGLFPVSSGPRATQHRTRFQAFYKMPYGPIPPSYNIDWNNTLRQSFGWWTETGAPKIRWRMATSRAMEVDIGWTSEVIGSSPPFGGAYLPSALSVGVKQISTLYFSGIGEKEIDLSAVIDRQFTGLDGVPFPPIDTRLYNIWVVFDFKYGGGGLMEDCVQPPNNLSGHAHWYPFGQSWTDPLGLPPTGYPVTTDVMSRIKLGVDDILMS